MNKRWKHTGLVLIGLVVGMASMAVFWLSAGLPTNSFAQGAHAPEGTAEGYWKPIDPADDPYPWDDNLRCAVWVNRGDHDVSLLQCVDKEHNKEHHED